MRQNIAAFRSGTFANSPELRVDREADGRVSINVSGERTQNIGLLPQIKLYMTLDEWTAFLARCNGQLL